MPQQDACQGTKREFYYGKIEQTGIIDLSGNQFTEKSYITRRAMTK